MAPLVTPNASGGLTASDTSGLIDPDILSQFNITLDYGHQSITFQKNHRYGRQEIVASRAFGLGVARYHS